MKILHLISGGDVGGAKTHVLSLLEGLGKTQTVRLVCFMDGPFAQEARELGIDTVVMDCGVAASIRALARMIEDERFEVVHCHGARANMTARSCADDPCANRDDGPQRLPARLSGPPAASADVRARSIRSRCAGFDYHIGVSDR